MATHLTGCQRGAPNGQSERTTSMPDPDGNADRPMSKAVRFDDYGGVEVLEVRDVARPQPGAEQVLVAVRAAGINPSEAKIRTG